MHQYQLQPYQGIHSRYRCPACQHRRKTFTLYISTETNEPLSQSVGLCGRRSKCGYHYPPKQWFSDGGIWNKEQRTRIKDIKQKSVLLHPCSFIPETVFKRSLSHYHQNNLVTYLTQLFGVPVADELIKRYCIGTAKHWPGATVFWQIDTNGRIRAGKVMLYNPTSGKRVKQPFNHITWAHSVLKLEGFRLRQCLFGEHLLAGNDLPVAIVESEKTALIASVHQPSLIWLAAGSLTNLNTQTCAVLKGRKVFLFPDLNGFELWSAKARQLAGIARFTVSDLLEREAMPSQRQQGLDIADYLMGFWPL
jgi:hypothetical protein